MLHRLVPDSMARDVGSYRLVCDMHTQALPTAHLAATVHTVYISQQMKGDVSILLRVVWQGQNSAPSTGHATHTLETGICVERLCMVSWALLGVSSTCRQTLPTDMLRPCCAVLCNTNFTPQQVNTACMHDNLKSHQRNAKRATGIKPAVLPVLVERADVTLDALTCAFSSSIAYGRWPD